MRINDVARSLMTQFRTDDGRLFYGELVKPATTTSRPDNFDRPRRLLRTGMTSIVKVGDVMLTSNGRRYLIADGEDSETARLQLREFRLFELDQYVTWKSSLTSVDPVTNLARDTSALQNLGNIYCAFEAPTTVTDPAIRVRQPKYRVIAKEDLQLNDILSTNLQVVVVQKLLGVTVAEVV